VLLLLLLLVARRASLASQLPASSPARQLVSG
jgi:hypothetical protein